MGAGTLARMRRTAWLLCALAGLFLLGAVTLRRAERAASTPAAAGGVAAGTPLGGTPAPGFTLVDQFGRRVSLRQFRGRAVILAFVDSRCTTICPLTAATLQEAQLLLGPWADRVQLLAVNVNAAAAAVADVRQWSAQHGMLHRWLFLTGRPAALARVWKAYGVYVQVVDGALMHDPAVYVLGPHGNERMLFVTQPSPLAPDLQAQGRALAAAAAAALHLPIRLRQRGPVPTPRLVPYGSVQGIGSFTLPALGAPAEAPPVAVGSGKPALVDFFSPTCTACVHSLAVLAAYARWADRHHGPRLVVVDLAFGGFTGVGVVPGLQLRRLPFPFLLDRTGAVTDAYGVTALPYQALTSARGQILWRHAGALSLAQLRAAVRAQGR